MAEIRDISHRRRNKKRRRVIVRLITFLVIVAIGLAAYLTRDIWIPKMEGIATRYMPKAENSGELAEGNFPIRISGGADYRVEAIDASSFAMLEDTHFSVYSADGELLYDRQHGYANAVMQVSGAKRMLVYDLGGYNFSLEGKYKNIYTKRLDNQIVSGSISKDGYAAIVTLSDRALCMLSVFDGNGNPVYYYHCTTGRITNVEFIRSGNGVILTEVYSEGGALYSRLSCYTFNSEEPVWQTSGVDALIFDVNIHSDGSIVAFGDDKCAFYERDGEYAGSLEYEDELIDYADSDGATVLLFKNSEKRKTTLTILPDEGESVSIEMGAHVSGICLDDGGVLVMDDSDIVMYGFDGAEINSVDISSDYDDFMRLGGYIYLFGYADINRIDFRA